MQEPGEQAERLLGLLARCHSPRVRLTHLTRVSDLLARWGQHEDVDVVVLGLPANASKASRELSRLADLGPLPLVTICPTGLDPRQVTRGGDVVLRSSDLSTAQLEQAVARAASATVHRAEPPASVQGKELARRYATLVEATAEAMLVVDAQRRIIFSNPAAERLLGAPPGGLVGARFDWPLDLSRPREVTLQRDGRNVSAELHTTRIPWGDTQAWLASLHDITERRASQAALERTTSALQAIARAFPDQYFRIRRDGVILSTHAERRTELGPGRGGDGQTLRDALPAEIADRMMTALEQALTAGGLVSVDFSLDPPRPEPRPERTGSRADLPADGRGRGWQRSRSGADLAPTPPRRYFEARFQAVSADEVFVVIRDVTERKVSDDALREVAESFRDLFNASREGIAVTRDGVIVDANEALTRLFAYERHELLGRGLASLVTEATPGASSRLEAAGGAHQAEVVGRRKDGGLVHVELTSKPYRYRGRPARIVYARDMTAQRQAEDKLLRSEQALRMAQKMEAIGRLAGGVAHDFNNLLTAIRGFGAFVLEALPSDSPAHEDMGEVLAAAERAANLTKQLLAFSRKQIIEPRVTSLNDLVLEMDKMIRRLVGEDIEVVTLTASRLWPAHIDPGQFEQVLLNLVVNARDAMQQGGTLTIETRNVVVGPEELAQHYFMSAGEYTQLVVRDTGHGMDEEVMSHLFEPFYTTKEKGKGTGLGLATCYGIVKQNDGYITAASRRGEGTEFVIWLPRAKGQPEVVRESSEYLYLPTGEETVLVVEDEPQVRNLAVRALKRQGYKVLEAHNGSEALLMFERGAPHIDLLVTDVVMPQMSGRELADRVAVLRPAMRVLFMSGYTDDAIVHRGVLEPGTAFIGKPFTMNALIRKVREVLDTPAPHRQ